MPASSFAGPAEERQVVADVMGTIGTRPKDDPQVNEWPPNGRDREKAAIVTIIANRG